MRLLFIGVVVSHHHSWATFLGGWDPEWGLYDFEIRTRPRYFYQCISPPSFI